MRQVSGCCSSAKWLVVTLPHSVPFLRPNLFEDLHWQLDAPLRQLSSVTTDDLPWNRPIE